MPRGHGVQFASNLGASSTPSSFWKHGPLRRGSHGFSVTAGDVESLAFNMLWLVKDQELCRDWEMGQGRIPRRLIGLQLCVFSGTFCRA